MFETHNAMQFFFFIDAACPPLTSLNQPLRYNRVRSKHQQMKTACANDGSTTSWKLYTWKRFKRRQRGLCARNLPSTTPHP